MRLFGWFRKRSVMSDADWEAIKAELRRQAQAPTQRNTRAEALRIIMASGVRYPRDERKQ